MVGGPLGAYFPTSLFDTPLDYEAFAAKAGLVGHGGIVVFDDTVDMAAQARFAFEFCEAGELRQMHALPHRRDARRETMDKRSSPGVDLDKNLSLCRGSVRDDDGSARFAPWAGLTPCPVKSAHDPFSRKISCRRTSAKPPNKSAEQEPMTMSLIEELDTGTPIRPAAETVTLTIDGEQVSVPKGTSVMAAAMSMGTKIPRLCATDSIEPFGSCRLCLVEIEGRRGTPASCTTPADEGMVVHTQNERLAKLRKGVMELYISDHPLNCLTCSANGDCELQDQAGAVGLRTVRYGYGGDNHLDAPTDDSNPYFAFEKAKCIVCNRCVRACEEVQGTFALTIEGRGFPPRSRPAAPISCRRNAFPAAPASRPARPPRSTRRA